jgi:thiosulfate reductase cytochrome b subunit
MMFGIRIPSVFAIKAWLGGLGLGTGIVGMALEARWLVWLAIGLLLGAFLLRLAEKKADTPTP